MIRLGQTVLFEGGWSVIFELIKQALVLNEHAFARVQSETGGLWMALFVVGLAGLSKALGQCMILFINRLRPSRFIPAVMLTAFSHVVGYGLWTVSVWLVGEYAFQADVRMEVIAAVVGLAYAPQLFAFFELTPFFGNPFGILLSLWSMVAIIVAVRVAMDLALWQAVVTSGLGWLLIQVWHRTLGRPVYALGRWLARRTMGVSFQFQYTMQDIPRLRRDPRMILIAKDVWLKEQLTGATPIVPPSQQERPQV
jgi:hypothetical protein